MTPLKRVTYIFEFILAAHMVFSLLIEIHSIVYPMHVLSEMLDQMPPYKRPKNPHANHNEIFDFISFFGFCIWLGLKYLFEGLRFNTLIVCAAELFFFLDRALQYADKVMCQVSAILTIIYIYTLVSYPVYEFPTPTGPHPVGYRFFRVQDAYHTKIAAFYPAEDPVKLSLTKVQIKRITKSMKWAPENKFVKQIYEYIISRQWVPYPEWVVDFIIGHIYSKRFTVLENAMLLKRGEGEEKTYPVIILSHGLSSHLHSHTTLAKQWASQGFIVLCPQHEELVYPWDDKSTKILWKNNKPEILEKYRRIRGAHVLWRVEQIQALINTISIKGKFSEIFQQEAALDTTRLIACGHSLGGATSIRLGQIDKRLTGVVTIDPWLFPLTNEQLEQPLLKGIASLHIFKELESESDELYPKVNRKIMLETNSGNPLYLAYRLKGMDHVHSTDLTYIMPSELEFSTQLRRSDNVHQITTSLCELTTIFIDSYLVNKTEEQDADEALLEPFDEWSKEQWKQVKQLVPVK